MGRYIIGCVTFNGIGNAVIQFNSYYPSSYISMNDRDCSTIHLERNSAPLRILLLLSFLKINSSENHTIS